MVAGSRVRGSRVQRASCLTLQCRLVSLLGQDVRSGWTALRRAPAFTVTAIATLALAIGATTSALASVYGVLLRPLPYAAPERLVRVWEERPGGVSPAGNRWLSRGAYAVWQTQSRTLDALGGYALVESHVRLGAEPVKVLGARISPAVLGTLGIAPQKGRLLTEDDDRAGAAPVVIVSDRLARERSGSPAGAAGSALVIDGIAHTIVGVMPPAFAFPEPGVRFWIPYAIPRSPPAESGPFAFTALARLKPGVTVAQAEAEGTGAARAAPPHALTGFFFGTAAAAPIVHVRPLAEDMTMGARPALSMAGAAAALVLLIACANVASLLLSRGVARQRELAIRAALGGSRMRLLRHLLTESALIAISGSAFGLILAAFLMRSLRIASPPSVPRVEDLGFDGSFVVIWIVTTLIAALATGIAPAIRAARVEMADALRGSDRSAAEAHRGARARRVRDALLVLEAAFAVILIVGATLLARSFVRLMAVDPGYTVDGVLIATMELPREAPETRIDGLIDGALERLRATPGVIAAGAGAMIPLMRQTAMISFAVPASAAGGKATTGRGLVYWVTPGYAEALGLRLREGRFFEAGDRRSGTLRTIVNEEFVRQHLASAPAAGLMLPGLVQAEGRLTAEIIGVVGDVLKDGHDRQPQPALYLIHGAHGIRIPERVQLVVRTAGDPAAFAPDVRALLRATDQEAVIAKVEPLVVSVAASLGARRLAALVMAGFATLAMALAGIGLFGALSYSVAQRRRELAIRAALGARRADIVRLVLREGLLVTLPGIVLGVAGAAAFSRLMQQLLFGVTPNDPITYAVASLALMMVSLSATVPPAFRAAAADPASTLQA
jgi:putative ABC transport system permease protein